jgi:methylenetetrahydrofolate reductase (NADPH)
VSKLSENLCRGALTLWIEVSPPRGISYEPLLNRLSVLLGHLDAINLTDNALAKVKMSALVFAAIVQQRLGLPVVLNMSCRDRNLLALKSDLLAAGALDIGAVVALTGDRLASQDSGGKAHARSVHDVDAMGLLKVVGELNRGELGEGKPLKSPPALLAGAVANPNRKNLKREVEVLSRKIEAGARFVMTQPVFDVETARVFAAEANALRIPLILGILPLKRATMASYIAAKIPDLAPAREYLASYADMREQEVRARSIEHSLELMTRLAQDVAGFNIMSGGGPSLAIELALRFSPLRAQLRCPPVSGPAAKNA